MPHDLSQLPRKRIALLRSRFSEVFHRQPVALVWAPGRVNLIGEHTDYNEGFVLPMAVDRYVTMAVGPRPDRRVCLASLDFGERDEFALQDIARATEHPWSNYIRGVAYFLQRLPAVGPLPGMDVVIESDVPIGAGLSSSAALEVAAALAFQALHRFSLPPLEMALLCQRAENEFVGMRCGVMDQMTSLQGREGCALLIDCRALEARPVPLPSGISVVVADTGVRRDLVHSEYNLRRAQCEEGVRLLQQRLKGVRALRDVAPAELERCRDLLPPLIYKRCRHVVRENQRVMEAARALEEGDLATFGRLMNESHRSLRDDYEVSCRELDVMVEAAQGLEGCLGSRMTGAGFGGSTVSLVKEEKAIEFKRKLAAIYQATTGLTPRIHICRTGKKAGFSLLA